MEVGQPLIVLSAFVAGIGVLMMVRLVWSIITHALQLIIIAGLFFGISQSGIVPAEQIKAYASGTGLQSGVQLISDSTESIRHWIENYDVEIHIIKNTNEQKQK